MRIYNIRLGFATNSSSTHSIIFLSNDLKLKDEYPNYDLQFGWGNFTLASAEEKKKYMAVVLRDNLNRVHGIKYDSSSEDKQRILNTVYGWLGINLSDAPYTESYIDHQSEQYLPKTWDEKDVNKEYFDDYLAYILRDNIAILGGNDNEDPHPLHSHKNVLPIAYPDCPGPNTVAKKDGDIWVLFERSNGTKVRISFD